MKVVVKLGGVNGSGKTTVARKIMEVAECAPHPHLLTSGKETMIQKGRANGLNIWVLGKYENACGGMDTISCKHDRFGLVRDVVAMRGKKAPDIILFEGLITGKTYGALGELSELHHTRNVARWLYAFMDTPFDVAAERVLRRRAAAGNAAPFDPERTMRSTYESCRRLEQYLRGEATSSRVSIGVQHAVHSIKHKSRANTAALALMNRVQELFHGSK